MLSAHRPALGRGCRCARCCARLGLWRDKTVEVPQLLLGLGRPVPGQGCCSASYLFDRCSFSAWLLTRPLCTMTGVMVQTAVPGQGCCYALCFYDRCTWFQTCRKRLEVSQMQFCVAGDVPVTMQRLCGVYGDGAVEVFFAVFLRVFRPPLRS